MQTTNSNLAKIVLDLSERSVNVSYVLLIGNLMLLIIVLEIIFRKNIPSYFYIFMSLLYITGCFYKA